MILLFSSGKKRKRAPPENATKNPSILNTGQKREQEFFFAREGLGCFLFSSAQSSCESFRYPPLRGYFLALNSFFIFRLLSRCG
jgi:hypothetical protein